MTSQALNGCSAESVGVYIKLMCVMHKSTRYGTILLKQKYKQTDKQIENFALQIANYMSFGVDVISRALVELLEEEVLLIEGEVLIQKRMVRDGELSDKRALAGKKGGESSNKSKQFASDFATAKNQANPVIVNVDVNESENADESVFVNEEEDVSRAREIAMRKIISRYEELVGPSYSGAVPLFFIECLAKGMQAEVVMAAIDTTDKNGVNSFPYLKAILERWLAEGILTMEKVENERAAKGRSQQRNEEKSEVDPFLANAMQEVANAQSYDNAIEDYAEH